MSEAPLLDWLRGKLADAEQSLRCREEIAASCERSADPKYWEELAKMPGVIVTTTSRGRKAPTAKDDLESAARHRRIAIKCRHEVKMFEATIAALREKWEAEA